MSEKIKSPLDGAEDPNESLKWIRVRIQKLESELESLRRREKNIKDAISDSKQQKLFML